MSRPTHLIQVSEVLKDYPAGEDRIKRVLNGIDLRVKQGEFVTLVGPTGCGKSTLLRLILGAEEPTSGTVRIDGEIIPYPNRDRGIVFQKYSLFPHKKVIQNIVFGLELIEFSLVGRIFSPVFHRKRHKEFKEQAAEYLRRIGLHPDDADKYPYQLSGGMRQRVATAQALVTKPRILLMDEPFGALDASTRQEMQLFILEQWKQHGMTVFFVTHDLKEAIYLGTRVIVLSQHYTNDDGSAAEGSKIVLDKPINGNYPRPTTFKYTPEFNALLEQVENEGLKPEHRQHVREFDLTHEDALRVPSEKGVAGE